MRRGLAPLVALAFAAAAPRVSAQEGYLLIVAGLSGEPRYADAFHDWATALQAAAEQRAGLPRANIRYLGEKPERDKARIDGPSTREGVLGELRGFAARARPGDTLTVVLLGHGSALSGEARFNLPGPDLTPADCARMLEPFALQRVVFVNASSASGEFLKPLAGPNRVIVTATKSGLEKNESVFGEHLAAAFAGDAADGDKDGRVSILEAFEYARKEVARSYEAGNRLQTEHALLEDSQQGALARTTFLAAPARAAEAAGSDPALVALERERRELEDRVEALKTRKQSLANDDYERQLEELLLALALKSEAIRSAKEAR